MVKLEQDVIVFEAEEHSIRRTILYAIDAVYEKLEKKGLTLVLEPDKDILLFYNRKWTAEVFVNLLENAIKYTDQGGMKLGDRNDNTDRNADGYSGILPRMAAEPNQRGICACPQSI